MAKKIDLSGLPDFDNVDVNSAEYLNLYRKSLNFIQQNIDSKIIYKEALQFLKDNDCDIDLFENLEEWRLLTIGKISMLIRQGIPMRDQTQDWLVDKVAHLEIIAKHIRDTVKVEEVDEDEDTGETPMVIKAREISTIILDNLFDAVLLSDEVSPFSYLSREAITSTRIINKIVEFIIEQRDSINEKNKKEHERKFSLIVYALKEIDKYTSNLKASKKTNKSAESQIDKLKYKKEDADLKIVSINPSMIIGAKSLVVYNPKYNQLGIYYAMDGGLGVKGTTIQNFNETKSKGRRIKKAAENVPGLRNGTISIIEKFFKDQTSELSDLTGRITEDVILVKTFK